MKQKYAEKKFTYNNVESLCEYCLLKDKCKNYNYKVVNCLNFRRNNIKCTK